MAVSPRTFAIDFDRGKVFANPTTEKAYAFKQFVNGDTERLKIYLVQAGSVEGALQALTPTGLTLKAALGIRVAGASPTVYTSVTLSPDSTNTWFEGNLPLNVAGVSNLFSASASNQSCLFEFELDDGGFKQTHAENATIVQQVISTTLIDTPAPDRAIGYQEATGLFVPMVGATQIIWTDSDGTGRRWVEYVQDGVKRLELIGT